MHDGDLIELDITGIAHGGVFVGRHEGRVVFVSDTLPGERVRARLTDTRKKAFWRAEAVEVVDAAAERRPHVWRSAGIDVDPAERVGGAEFGHIDLSRAEGACRARGDGARRPPRAADRSASRRRRGSPRDHRWNRMAHAREPPRRRRRSRRRVCRTLAPRRRDPRPPPRDRGDRPRGRRGPRGSTARAHRPRPADRRTRPRASPARRRALERRTRGRRRDRGRARLPGRCRGLLAGAPPRRAHPDLSREDGTARLGGRARPRGDAPRPLRRGRALRRIPRRAGRGVHARGQRGVRPPCDGARGREPRRVGRRAPRPRGSTAT